MQTSSPGKVLFISHEASRSGAPIVLLHLLKWIKNNSGLQFEILLLADGPLKTDFEQLGKTFVLSDLVGQHTYPARIRRKILGKTLNDEYNKAADYLSKRGYDLIYGNTIVSLPWLDIFKEQHALKTLCCIHELSYVLGHFFSKEYLEENLKLVDSIIAVSNAVKEILVNNYNVQSAKIQLQYEFIDTAGEIITDRVKRQDLGVETGAFIIGTGGTPEWRKVTDLLIPLTNKLLELYPDFKFKIVWLGAGAENGFVKQLLYDAQKCNIADKFVFIDSKSIPLEYINFFDVFVLLSREDPFPLIALEAAFLKKPIIAFENSGGMPELINQGTGLLAPYLDITILAHQLYKLSSDKELIKKLGEEGNKLVVSKYSTAVVSPGIFEIINDLLEPANKPIKQHI